MMRQLSFTKFEIGFREMRQRQDGLYELVTVPVTTAESTHLTKSEIRKAIMEAGHTCPKGLDVYAAPVAKVVYRFTTEDLLAIAKVREEKPLAASEEEAE